MAKLGPPSITPRYDLFLVFVIMTRIPDFPEQPPCGSCSSAGQTSQLGHFAAGLPHMSGVTAFI